MEHLEELDDLEDECDPPLSRDCADPCLCCDGPGEGDCVICPEGPCLGSSVVW